MQEVQQFESIDHFPYTHGDLIERNREILSKLQKEDILRVIAENKEKRRQQLDKSEFAAETPRETVDKSANRYNPDRARRQFIMKTMDSAIDRYRTYMQRLENEKQMQHEDFIWRI